MNVASDLALRLVPDELWELVAALIPQFAPRRQGGGTAPIEDRAVFTAIVYVLTSGCAWRHLPAEFGVSHVPHENWAGVLTCEVLLRSGC